MCRCGRQCAGVSSFQASVVAACWLCWFSVLGVLVQTSVGSVLASSFQASVVAVCWFFPFRGVLGVLACGFAATLAIPLLASPSSSSSTPKMHPQTAARLHKWDRNVHKRRQQKRKGRGLELLLLAGLRDRPRRRLCSWAHVHAHVRGARA
eukprot:1465299-Rhodomonas_salina.1